MKLKSIMLFLLSLAVLAGSTAAYAQEDDSDGVSRTSIYPIAIFPFQERGKEVEDLGGKVTDLLFASMLENHSFFLVEREDIKKLLDEGALNLSGMASPETANQIGQLTGAKILVTGSVFQVGETQYVVGKIISAETGRVFGASAKGGVEGKLDDVVSQLADKVAEKIEKEEKNLVAKEVTKKDLLAELQKKLGDGKRPSVYIDIEEQHISQPAKDPAAATELTLFCESLGFDVIDPVEGDTTEADIKISGQGFSQFATRNGDIASVKARLEVKAVYLKSGRLLAVERQTTIACGLADELATGKSALQDAAAKIATRLLPKIADYDRKDEKKKK